MAIHTSKWRCVWHHCKDGPQVEVMEKNRWCCGETGNHPKNVTFFEGVQHAFFFYSHCKTMILHKSQWKWGAKRHHHDINMWQMPMFPPRRTSQWTWKLMKTLSRFPGRSVISGTWGCGNGDFDLWRKLSKKVSIIQWSNDGDITDHRWVCQIQQTEFINEGWDIETSGDHPRVRNESTWT